MSTLLNNRSHIDRLVPPCWLGNSLVGCGLDLQLRSMPRKPKTYVSRVGSHDGKVVVVDDLLHVLNTSEVSKHVTDRDDVSILDERLRDALSTLDLTGTDGLFDKVGDLGEELDQGKFKIGSFGSTTSVCGGASDDNGAGSQLYSPLCGDASLLRLGATTGLQVCVVILDSFVCLGTLVSGQDERCSLSLEDLFGTGDRGVDKGSDLESGTELVFESERVASCQYR